MVVLQPPMIGPPSTITPPETTRRRKRSRSEEDGLQRPFEEDAFEENGTFIPAVLLLFQNGDGIPRFASRGPPPDPPFGSSGRATVYDPREGVTSSFQYNLSASSGVLTASARPISRGSGAGAGGCLWRVAQGASA